MKRILTLLLISGAFLGALYLLVAVAGQRRLVFPGSLTRFPDRDAQDPPPAGVERHWIETRAGPVESWFFPARVPAAGGSSGSGPGPEPGPRPRPLLLFAHGNGEIIDDWEADLRALAALGLHVYAVEYPGYGISAGRPGQEAIRAVYLKALDRALDRPDVDRDRVVFLGRSIGGGVVMDLSLRREPRAIILQSTFASLRELVTRYSRLPGRFVRDPFESEAALGRFGGPVLIFHSRGDDLIPFEHAQRMAGLERTAGGGEPGDGHDPAPTTRLVELEGCGHGDCPSDWDAFVAEVDRFLRAEGILPREEELDG